MAMEQLGLSIRVLFNQQEKGAWNNPSQESGDFNHA